MHHPTRLHMLFHSHACLPFCVTPLLKQLLPVLEYQPVVHLLRSLPRIRSRLTLRRRSLLRNPYAFGGKDSHLSFRYSYQHSHFPQVHRTFQFDFYPMGTLPYPVYFTYTATASVSYFSPGNLRRRVSRPVSYYALFKCMAASKPTSWLFSQLHIVFHLAYIWDLSCGSGLFPF